MTYTIDRFSGDYALLEDDEQTVVRVERSLLPVEAREGDVLIHENGEYTVDRDATADRRKLMNELLASLWEDGCD